MIPYMFGAATIRARPQKMSFAGVVRNTGNRSRAT
jgi:hypothetical protein